MSSDLKTKILESVRDRDTKELVLDHVTGVSWDESARSATVSVDKKYALHLLSSYGHGSALIGAVETAFGPGAKTALRMANPHRAHEREALVPHSIHFG